MRKFQRKSAVYFTLLVTTGSLASCASARKNPSTEGNSASTAPAADSEYKTLQSQIAQLNARLGTIENRLGSVTENLNTTRTHVENLIANQKAKPAPVIAHAAERGGTQAEPTSTPTDPLAGFSDDNATRSYRKSILLYQAQRYREAVASFGDFLEKYPDHPLAGSAQFYVGESYLMQGDLKLAVQEFQRVLTSYDRSAYVAQTLREMAEVEDRLQKTEEANRHRQLLTSLFPHSPSALAKTVRAEVPKTESPQNGSPKTEAPQNQPQNKLDEPPLTEPLHHDEAESRKSAP